MIMLPDRTDNAIFDSSCASDTICARGADSIAAGCANLGGKLSWLTVFARSGRVCIVIIPSLRAIGASDYACPRTNIGLQTGAYLGTVTARCWWTVTNPRVEEI